MATITSNVVTGNWSATGSWSGAVVPGAGDLAIIANGAIITVDVDTTFGATTSVGIGVTINGASAVSFGTLRVASGVTLTMRGFNNTTNAAMQINAFGLFAPQPGSTVKVGGPSDFGTTIVNNGRFEAIGSSGSHITFTVETAPNWGSLSDTNSKVTAEAKTAASYDTTANIAVTPLGFPQVSNSAKTGLGSFGNSSLTFSASSPTLTTEVDISSGDLSGINSSGKYGIDYDTGILYSYAGVSHTATYWKLDKVAADWKGWGINSKGAVTGCTCLLNYCDFTFMGAVGSGIASGATQTAAPVNLSGHLTAAANSGSTARLAYVTNCTFKGCVRWVYLLGCQGTSGDPILITGNTFNDGSGGSVWDGVSQYGTATATSFIKIDSNTFNTRGTAVTIASLQIDCSGWVITNNTGVAGTSFISGGTSRTPFPSQASYDASFQNQPNTPDFYVGYNDVRGIGNTSSPDGSHVVVGGTSGHPAIVEHNHFHHAKRLGWQCGSYVTFQYNRFGKCYHHGFTGNTNDDQYITDVAWYNNLFYSDSGSTTSAIQLGYNHRVTYNNVIVANNTCDGWKNGLIDFNDLGDLNGPTLATNVSIVNNIIKGGNYAFSSYSSGTIPWNVHVLECDYNNINGQATGFATGSGGLAGTVSTGFAYSTSKYNRLTGGSRNVNGVALFDATYTSFHTGSLVYTVNTLGTDQTLSWDGGTAVQLIYDSGTSSGPGLRTLPCSTKSTWNTNNNSIRTKWVWIVSGTGSGQARAITWATNNTCYAITIAGGGVSFSVGQYLSASGGTRDQYPAVIKVTSVSAGVITGVQIISGGGYSTVPSNPVTFSRFVQSGNNATFNCTWGPGLCVAPDFTTALDNTSVFAIVNSMVTLTDSGGTNTVRAGLYLPDPSNWQNAIQLPTFSAADSLNVVVTNSPTGSPGYSATSGDSTAANYQWTSGSAKDTGTSDNAPSTDYFGTSRPQGSVVDMGFFELVQATGAVRRRRIITGGE